MILFKVQLSLSQTHASGVSELSEDEKHILTMIATRLVVALSPKHIYEETIIEVLKQNVKNILLKTKKYFLKLLTFDNNYVIIIVQGGI